MAWLITGGAGYIGAHVVRAMHRRGDAVVALDDFSTGERDRLGDVAYVVGDVQDRSLVSRTIREHDVQGIIHFAAKKRVGESVQEPLLYYRENVGGLLSLLEAATAENIDKFVFSSSAAAIGATDAGSVTEEVICAPINPYGETKLVGEWMCHATSRATGMRTTCLRYFNVAGAGAPDLGDPAILTLIPLVFDAITRGEQPQVFGADYPTPDGTCIRDYVHVLDVADAHIAAIDHLDSGCAAAVYNVGRGHGYSVHEVLGCIEEVTGVRLSPTISKRRPGDAARVVASVDKIRRELGWSSSHDLDSMVVSAWAAWQHHRGMR